MSRSGYTDDCENLALYRASVDRAFAGKRGQKLLRDLAAALDAMPVKELAPDSLVTAEGEFCTLGVLGHARGLDLRKIDADDPDEVAAAFGVARSMAAEIVYMNDEYFQDWVWVEMVGPPKPYDYHHIYGHPTVRQPIPEPKAARWKFMRDWVTKQIKAPEIQAPGAGHGE